MGIMDKVKGIFGGKKEEYQEIPRRIEPKQEEVANEEFTPRYKLAKQWREEKAMDEPLVKRNDFKRRV